ncbi:MAG: rRNA maturation RNase YbeY [Lachnospiraceae bacterium]|jgi:probable rRNA maturation factor|nr:rRNA maturation RNase YbeY [Lachnospiraceae bacterium]
MTVLLDKETDITLGIEYYDIACKVVDAALSYVDCPFECEVNIMLTDNEGIREVNRDTRNIDSPTDVLSFPGLDFETAGDFSAADSDVAGSFNSDTGELMLGDIMISLERVISQAEEYGHSVTREFAFLIAHSMLHLSGYDHIDDEERVVMEQMQDEILNMVGYTRDCI